MSRHRYRFSGQEDGIILECIEKGRSLDQTVAKLNAAGYTPSRALVYTHGKDLRAGVVTRRESVAPMPTVDETAARTLIAQSAESGDVPVGVDLASAINVIETLRNDIAAARGDGNFGSVSSLGKLHLDWTKYHDARVRELKAQAEEAPDMIELGKQVAQRMMQILDRIPE